jgi:hypothetical protein
LNSESHPSWQRQKNVRTLKGTARSIFRGARRSYRRALGFFSSRQRAAAIRDRVYEHIEDADEAIAKLQDAHAIHVPRLQKELNQLSSDLNDANQLADAAIVFAFHQRKARAEQIKERLARVTPIMYTHGWWVIGRLPDSVYEYILANQNSLTRASLGALIIQHFSQDDYKALVETVEGWNATAFLTRRSIFGDALWAHRHRKYLLSVPALTLQVEGVIRSFVSSTKRFSHRRFQRVLSEFKKSFAILSDIPADRPATMKEVIAIINYYDLRALEALYDSYAPEEHQDPVSIQRHAIAHGLWTNYDSEEFSLRLFLQLDMLHSMLVQLTHQEPLGLSSEPSSLQRVTNSEI